MSVTPDAQVSVLFLSQENASRSIMAEAILNREGMGRFKAHSAGLTPHAQVDPVTVRILHHANYTIDTMTPKSWESFAGTDAPQMDFIFTIFDGLPPIDTPAWPGNPLHVRWEIPDPLAFDGMDQERHLFTSDVFRMLYNRITIFANLPFDSLDRLSLQRRLDDLGQADGEHPKSSRPPR